MTTTQLLPRQPKGGTMPRVSLRTLILLVELLVTVVAFQYLTTAKPAQAHVLWLAADCHTAASIQRRLPDPVAPASAPAVAGEDTKEP
jgi:hypothetical protein